MFSNESFQIAIQERVLLKSSPFSKSFKWNLFQSNDFDYFGRYSFQLLTKSTTVLKPGIQVYQLRYGLHYFLLFCMLLLQDLLYHFIKKTKHYLASAENWYWKLSTIQMQKRVCAVQSKFDNCFKIFLFLSESFWFHSLNEQFEEKLLKWWEVLSETELSWKNVSLNSADVILNFCTIRA